MSFLEYCKHLKEERYESKGNYDNWDAAQKHLERYCSPSVTFNDIDENFIKGFKKHLNSKARTKNKKKRCQAIFR